MLSDWKPERSKAERQSYKNVAILSFSLDVYVPGIGPIHPQIKLLGYRDFVKCWFFRFMRSNCFLLARRSDALTSFSRLDEP